MKRILLGTWLRNHFLFRNLLWKSLEQKLLSPVDIHCLLPISTLILWVVARLRFSFAAQAVSHPRAKKDSTNDYVTTKQ